MEALRYRSPREEVEQRREAVPLRRQPALAAERLRGARSPEQEIASQRLLRPLPLSSRRKPLPGMRPSRARSTTPADPVKNWEEKVPQMRLAPKGKQPLLLSVRSFEFAGPC